jgi:hypothetical protein
MIIKGYIYLKKNKQENIYKPVSNVGNSLWKRAKEQASHCPERSSF